ncbi:UDP-N-acetylmuramoylalanyl-D-glutamate--2,6-diaminopimelate ligase [hydrothermal vent metagenome]|uniref:UDP-N-acetylmuramoylalanyl-D-glutamate--2,6-diaminopimelate ligase n=1 Tax=hydrothermal vent metagenome TaxID=652676 RepID=A0A3B0SR00_9ZZZZ
MKTQTTIADLARLVQPAEVVGGDPDVVLTDVTHDSRQVKPGTLFVAIRGEHTDGHRFVESAVISGAPAVLVEERISTDVPQIIVGDTRRVLGPVAAAVHGFPAADMVMIGVTGTNGKTTVTHMLESMCRADGQITGLIGTIGAVSAGEPIKSVRTTPEAPDLHRLLARMRDDHVQVVGVEVSSHALALGRVDGVLFDVAVFTNLTQDHLDYHLTMEDYFLAKAELFDVGRSRRGVVWVSSSEGMRMAEVSTTPVTTIGWLGSGAHVEVSVVEATIEGSTFVVRSPTESFTLAVPLPGMFNVENAAIAAYVARSIGVSVDAVTKGLVDLGSIPGRYEVVATEPAVVVDYAHTPEAIAAVIAASRPLTGGRIIVVFGAGGDRDAAKRPLMGAAAATADHIVITTDNPRSEDPGALIAAIQGGMVGTNSVVEVVEDRADAIDRALEVAQPNDIVLILGKGHETGIDRHGVVEPFDDRDVARALVHRRSRPSPC